MWYALYAWGCPTILTIILAIVNFTPGKHRKPGIGLNTCWFFGRISFVTQNDKKYLGSDRKNISLNKF